MILNRSFYSKVSVFKAYWYRSQLAKLQGDRLFKAFRLHRTGKKDKFYFYSPRLKRVPRFTGSPEMLKNWNGASMLEELCPTRAIEVLANEICISQKGCISCGLCVEAAPEGMLEFSLELPWTSSSVEKIKEP